LRQWKMYRQVQGIKTCPMDRIQCFLLLLELSAQLTGWNIISSEIPAVPIHQRQSTAEVSVAAPERAQGMDRFAKTPIKAANTRNPSSSKLKISSKTDDARPVMRLEEPAYAISTHLHRQYAPGGSRFLSVEPTATLCVYGLRRCDPLWKNRKQATGPMRERYASMIR